ncbi:MAG: anti-sigma factor family protein [Actinomycetota bacterium]
MNRVEEMSCKEIVGLVTDYLEGTLSSAQVERFELHLEGCEGCANYLNQMRRTIELTGWLTEDSLSPAASAALLHAFRDWKAGQNL